MNDPVANKTTTYLYDVGGNILEKNEYVHTTSDTLGTPTDTISYTYDEQWKDLLTSYDGKSITYDAIGNPIDFMGSTLTWERGRRLSTMTLADGSTASYKYNADGVRTQKTVGGVTTDYFLEGSTIVAQKTGNDVIWYYFGGDGTRDAIEYNGNVYYYMYNPQGDVIGLFDGNANVVVEYTYDSWGKVKTTGTLKDTLGKANPFRYRGYYYDEESGMYYLNSRYYHPEIGRFINADSVTDGGAGIIGTNLFVYAANNPVTNSDPSGQGIISAILGKVALGAALGAVSNTVSQLLNNGWNWKALDYKQIGIAALSGAVSGFISGGAGAAIKAAGAKVIVQSAVNIIASGVSSTAGYVTDSLLNRREITASECGTYFATGLATATISLGVSAAYKGVSFKNYSKVDKRIALGNNFTNREIRNGSYIKTEVFRDFLTSGADGIQNLIETTISIFT